jgi:hypothetical protein
MSDVEKMLWFSAEGLGVIIFASIIAMKNKTKSRTSPREASSGWVVGIFLIGLAEIVRRSQSQVGMTEVTVGSGS